MEKRILILGGGKEQLPAVERAKRKGIKTLVFDMKEDAVASKAADEFYPISNRDVQRMLGFFKKYDKKIDGIMAIASDIPHYVSQVGEHLGLRCIPQAAANLTVDKLEMKKELKAKGVKVPAFMEIRDVQDLEAFIKDHSYPVVVKPVDNSGARGVLKLDEKVDLSWAYNYSKQYARSGTMMVEKFLEGPQISTEGLVYEDKLRITGFADRNYDRMEQFAPYIIEDGGDSPTRLNPEAREAVCEEFEKAVYALGINWGPAKGDMVYSQGKAYVIEIAARLSGGNFCYDHVPLATGVDIVDILIDMAVGNQVDIQRFQPTKNQGVAQRYFFPRPGRIKEVKGLDTVSRMPNIKKIDYYAVDFLSSRQGIVEKAVSHPNRVGYVIAVGKDKDEAVYWAKRAIDTVEFVIE